MAVNQPIIGDDQAENSWKLEITNQANNEEARVNALASQLEELGRRTTAVPNIEVWEATVLSTQTVQDPAIPGNRVITLTLILPVGTREVQLAERGVASSTRTVFPTDGRQISTFLNGLKLLFVQTRVANPANPTITISVPESLVQTGATVQLVIDERI